MSALYIFSNITKSSPTWVIQVWSWMRKLSNNFQNCRLMSSKSAVTAISGKVWCGGVDEDDNVQLAIERYAKPAKRGEPKKNPVHCKINLSPFCAFIRVERAVSPRRLLPLCLPALPWNVFFFSREYRASSCSIICFLFRHGCIGAVMRGRVTSFGCEIFLKCCS